MIIEGTDIDVRVTSGEHCEQRHGAWPPQVCITHPDRRRVYYWVIDGMLFSGDEVPEVPRPEPEPIPDPPWANQ